MGKKIHILNFSQKGSYFYLFIYYIWPCLGLNDQEKNYNATEVDPTCYNSYN